MLFSPSWNATLLPRKSFEKGLRVETVAIRLPRIDDPFENTRDEMGGCLTGNRHCFSGTKGSRRRRSIVPMHGLVVSANRRGNVVFDLSPRK